MTNIETVQSIDCLNRLLSTLSNLYTEEDDAVDQLDKLVARKLSTLVEEL